MDQNPPLHSSNPIDYKKNSINENVLEYKFVKDDNTFTFQDFINISKNQAESSNFTEAMSKALTDSQAIFNSFFWECPPIRQDTISNQFQFVTVKAPGLSRVQQDYSSFKKQFEKFKQSVRGEIEDVCSFKNLGGDAMLVVPLPNEGKDYTHIAKFNENADFNTKKKFWGKIAEEFGKALKDNQPKWLSTNGMGVYYLHVRIDQRPKYYEYENYRRPPSSSAF